MGAQAVKQTWDGSERWLGNCSRLTRYSQNTKHKFKRNTQKHNYINTQGCVSLIFNHCFHTSGNSQVSIMALDFSWFIVSLFLFSLKNAFLFRRRFKRQTKVSYLNIKLPACKLINFFTFDFLFCSVKSDWYMRATLVCFQVWEREAFIEISVALKQKVSVFSL